MILFPYLLSFWVIVPFSNLPAMEPKTLLASFAKSKSRTSAGETGTIAKASLSSFTGEVPIWNPEKFYHQTTRQKTKHWFIYSLIIKLKKSHTPLWQYETTDQIKLWENSTTLCKLKAAPKPTETSGEIAKCCCKQWKKSSLWWLCYSRNWTA